MGIRTLRAWIRDDEAVAAIEAGILFPLLMLILCCTIDTGIGLLTSQKSINASQMMADLLSRGSSVTSGDINDAIVAGQMAMAPYPAATLGVDIAGIQYVGPDEIPMVMWRRTQNMPANDTITEKAAGLGDQDEGVVVVTVEYVYNPIFTAYLTGPIVLHQESYARSRKGTFVTSANGSTP